MGELAALTLAIPALAVPLRYGGLANCFVGEFTAAKKAVYDIVLTAFDPASGNSGVAETTFEIDN